VGESSFWYRPTRVVPDQRPLNGRCCCWWLLTYVTHTHTRLTAPLSGTTWVSRYQKGKTSLDYTEARDSDWQCHQLGCMQVFTSLQKDNHASTQPLSFLQARCFSCLSTNSVKALKANVICHVICSSTVPAVALAEFVIPHTIRYEMLF